MAEILQKNASYAVPVYVDASNGRFFDLARKILPKLNLLFLMGALHWRKRQAIVVYIGPRIETKDFDGLSSQETMTILRSKAYALKNTNLKLVTGSGVHSVIQQNSNEMERNLL